MKHYKKNKKTLFIQVIEENWNICLGDLPKKELLEIFKQMLQISRKSKKKSSRVSDIFAWVYVDTNRL